MRRLVPIALLLLATTAAIADDVRVPTSQAQITLSFAPVVRTAAPAVVNIYASRIVARRASPFAADPFFRQFFRDFDLDAPRVQNSLGSGVILSHDGIVVSNYHVVGEATEIRAQLSDGREFEGRVILSDQDTDLAVIRLDGATNLPALEFRDSDDIEVGDLVLAIGNPFGVGQTVTSGIVSGLARSGAGGGRRGTGYFIQTDAPINPGNSGGALVDMAGRLVGINTSILTRSGGSNGIGFAIPANLVRQYVEQAAAGARVLVRPWPGIAVQPVEGALAEALGLETPRGAVITETHPASAFAAAGLRPGDVILSLAGKPVGGAEELAFRLTSLGIGAEADLLYFRDGAQQRALVLLAAAPDSPPSDPVTIDTRNSLGGLGLARVNPALIERMELPLSATGVVVTAVDGYAARTGLRPGDLILTINGRGIETPGDAEAVAKEFAPVWEVELQRGGSRAVTRIRDR